MRENDFKFDNLFYFQRGLGIFYNKSVNGKSCALPDVLSFNLYQHKDNRLNPIKY